MAVQQNGNGHHPRNTGNMKSAMTKELGLSDKQAHDRLTYLFGAAIVSPFHVQENIHTY